jgi:short-subunit dehydrogenase
VQGDFGFPSGYVYVSTKFAVEGLSESLAYGVSPFEIQIILIEPGVIKTKFFKGSTIVKNLLIHLHHILKCSKIGILSLIK